MAPSTERRKSRDSGYTLIEMVAVLALIGVMVTTSATGFIQVLPRWRLTNSARDVAAVIKGARAKAILDGSETSMSFDADGGRYSVLWGPTANPTVIVAGPSGPLRFAQLPDGVTFARPDGVDTITLDVPGEDDVASFDEIGRLVSVATPGYVFLGDTKRAIYVRVKVNMVGTVRVERWDGSGWG